MKQKTLLHLDSLYMFSIFSVLEMLNVTELWYCTYDFLVWDVLCLQLKCCFTLRVDKTTGWRSINSIYVIDVLLLEVVSFNPLDSKGNYSATSNNTKLVHWPLMCGLLHLVQRGEAWAGCGPTQSPPRCIKCYSPPVNGQCTRHCIAIWWSVPSVALRF